MKKIAKQAFTLIELLVVIAIIGILSGLIVVAMGGMTTKATIAKAQIFSNSLRNSLMMDVISEWKFDGNTNDSWSGGNIGTWSGSGGGTNTSINYRLSSECISGQCLNFDGTDDLVTYPNTTNLNFGTGISFTISAWIKRTDLSTHTGAIIQKGSMAGRYIFGVVDMSNTFGLLRVNTYYGTGMDYWQTVIDNFKDTNWHNLTMVVDKINLAQTVYYDGIKQGNSLTIINGDNTTTQDLTIGTTFNGLLDDIRLYKAAMPTSQVRENYYTGLNKLLINGGITKEEYLGRINQNLAEK